MSTSRPNLSTGSVATPLSGLPVYCPICEKVPLHGKQLVCSAKCRIQKSMQTRSAKRAERDAKAKMELRAAQQSIAEALTLLEPES